MVLSISCCLFFAVSNFPAVVRMAKSSAWRALGTFFLFEVVCYVVYKNKKEGWWNDSTLRDSLLDSDSLLGLSSSFTLVIRKIKKPLIQRFIFPSTLFSNSLSRSPSFYTLSKAFVRSINAARTFFFSWKASSISWATYTSWSLVLWFFFCMLIVCSLVVCSSWDVVLSVTSPRQLSRLAGL